jgi:hypothetical protein
MLFYSLFLDRSFAKTSDFVTIYKLDYKQNVRFTIDVLMESSFVETIEFEDHTSFKIPTANSLRNSL